MPKKKNFLGGMQNYNAETGEYEPALVGSNGERPSSFKSFKKEDSEFTKANDKRLGKSKKGLGYDPRDRKASTENHNKIINEINDRYGNSKMSKKEYWDAIDREVDRWNNEQQYWYEHDDSYDPDVAEQQAERRNKGIFAGMENKENVNSEATNESDDEEGVGKIIKYQPFLRSYKNDESGYGEDVRAKKLNNGLAMETKKFKSSGQFDKNEKGQYVAKQYYKLVDIESGLSVGRAESYEEALAKSKDPEFVEKLEKARKTYWEKYPERKRTQEKAEEKKSEPVKKLKDEASKKEMDKARKRMEKYWARTNANEHMKSEMNYLLSNFENDNDKEAAISLAKDNVKKWQKLGYLDTNEMRDEKLVYFQKMIEYMEKNK